MSVGIGPQRNDISTNSKQESMDSNQKPKSFDKMNCIKNIRYLVEKQNLKIGELEKASGNSIGYLSRLEKQEKSADPSAELLVTAAKMLGVTLDELVFDKLEDLSANEEIVISFLKRLIENTKKDRVSWEKETIEQHKQYERAAVSVFDCPHVLYDMYEEVIDTYPTLKGWKYSSRFFPDEIIKVRGISYHTQINEFDDNIYIMGCVFGDSSVDRKLFYEIYHIDVDNIVYPVCSTYDADERIVRVVERLVEQIKESQGRIRLSQKTKMLLETYK